MANYDLFGQLIEHPHHGLMSIIFCSEDTWAYNVLFGDFYNFCITAQCHKGNIHWVRWDDIAFYYE